MEENKSKKKIIVTYPQAIFEKVISRHTLQKKTLTIKLGQKIGLDLINETLFEYGFEKVNFVSQPGEFSVRGGIIDVFSFSHQHPYRIEFFDQEIESLRSFDVNTQLSISPLSSINLLPNTSKISFTEKRKSIIESLSNEFAIVINQLDLCLVRLEDLFKKAQKKFEDAIKNFDDLPKNAKIYIQDLEKFIETKISSISTSPEREDTILIQDPFKN